MKPLYIIVVLLLVSCKLTSSTPASASTLEQKGNQKIIQYIDSKIGKKIDRGECWDLAAGALSEVGCEHKSLYVYGTKLNYKTEELLPGDILQFENVKVKYTKGSTTYFETMVHHTAIIYKVKNGLDLIIADQNGEQGKKVALDDLNLEHVVKGSIYAYRPVCR